MQFFIIDNILNKKSYDYKIVLSFQRVSFYVVCTNSNSSSSWELSSLKRFSFLLNKFLPFYSNRLVRGDASKRTIRDNVYAWYSVRVAFFVFAMWKQFGNNACAIRTGTECVTVNTSRWQILKATSSKAVPKYQRSCPPWSRYNVQKYFVFSSLYYLLHFFQFSLIFSSSSWILLSFKFQLYPYFSADIMIFIFCP